MHSPRSLFGFDFVLFAEREQKLPVERASDKLAGVRHEQFCAEVAPLKQGNVFNMFATAAISSRQTIVNKYLQNNEGVNWNGLTIDDSVIEVWSSTRLDSSSFLEIVAFFLFKRSLVQCDGISATVKGVHKHVFTIHSDNRNKQENNYPVIDIPSFAFDGMEWPFTPGQGDIKWPQNMKWIGYEPGQMPVADMKRPISGVDFIKWANMGFDDKVMDFANTKNPSADFNSENRRNNNRRPSSNTEGATVIPKDGNESTKNTKYGENIEEISGESNDGGAFQNGEKNGKFIYRSTKTENMTGKDFVYICPEGMKRYLSHIFGMMPNARPSVDSSSYQIDSSEGQSEPIKRIGVLRNRGNKKNFPAIQSRRNSSGRKFQLRTQPRSLSILRKSTNR
ncbi:hypothetical protein TNCV_1166941 [Trichonephila clavipes]|uniref:Uncharacterized protein n=1 Tax=Trichonephila clavipes TaxID=2585209 RepID=A0A8X6VSW6_TRICX|nr:hypothetical protein TNCV_1166941 [Trichonephila clavipes]